MNLNFSFELARIPSLEIAFGCLMTVHAKATFKIRAQCKLNNIPCDFKFAQEAAQMLKPKLKKLRIPLGEFIDFLGLKILTLYFGDND